MDILLVLLRLLHIVSAVIWFGLGVAVAFYILPAGMSSGESGMRFLKAIFNNTSFARIFPSAAGLTLLAGILLYLISNAPAHFSSTGNMVLGIGAAAGLLANIHGGAVTGRATGELGKALAEHIPDGAQPISESAMSTLNELTAKVLSHARISLVLMAIALIGMGSARYL